jgi:hypothetical protein
MKTRINRRKKMNKTRDKNIEGKKKKTHSIRNRRHCWNLKVDGNTPILPPATARGGRRFIEEGEEFVLFLRERESEKQRARFCLIVYFLIFLILIAINRSNSFFLKKIYVKRHRFGPKDFFY